MEAVMDWFQWTGFYMITAYVLKELNDINILNNLNILNIHLVINIDIILTI